MSIENNKNSDIAEFKPKLKQRQRVVHTLRAIIRISKYSFFSAIFYGIYLLWNMPFWNIQIVEINGVSPMGYNYIEKFNLVKNYQSTNILSLDPSKLKKALDNNRIFKEININRKLFPSILQIDFIERLPYMTIFDEKKGSDITIDEDGIVLTYTKKFNNSGISNYSIKNIKNYKITEEQVNAIRVIEHFIQTKKIPDMKVFDLTNPNNIILHTDKNIILIGDLEDFIMKIKTIFQLEALSKNTKNELEYIDVRYWKNPVLKVKEGSD